MMIKCPVCNNRHVLPDNYDNKDFICPNVGLTPKIFQNLIPTDLLTRAGYNMNTRSTKVDEARPTTIIVEGPSYRRTGDPNGEFKKNY